MTEAVTVALISGVFSAAAAFGGVLTSQRLSGYRIEQLEKKVDKHNNLVERMTAAEVRIENMEKEMELI